MRDDDGRASPLRLLDEDNARRAERGAAWERDVEPVDFLGADLTGEPELTAEHVPGAVYGFAVDTAGRMGVDPACVALCAVVALASVISDDWAIQPKAHDYTWVENARLWGAVVGDPSTLKSPVIAAATKPIDRLERDARRRHQGEVRDWQRQAEQAREAGEAPPPRPKLHRYMIEGATIEALSEVLRDDDEGGFLAPCGKVLARHDEMAEFIGGLDRYRPGGRGGADRGAYLRLYNGGRYAVDRIGRGSFCVPNWSSCLLGGIQPALIQRIAQESEDDGLLQRFMYCCSRGQWRGEDRKPDRAALERYEALFVALPAIRPTPAPDGEHHLPVKLHGDAQRHRQDIDALVLTMRSMPDSSPRLRAALAKWHGLFGRLCLAFHVIELADAGLRGERGPWPGIVVEPTARKAAAYMRDILLPHLLAAEEVMFSTVQTTHARWVAGRILSRRAAKVSARDILRAHRPLRAPEERGTLQSVMDALAALGWVEPVVDPDNPYRSTGTWTVNPLVHERFPERAEAEAERRREARERIAVAAARVRAARRSG